VRRVADFVIRPAVTLRKIFFPSVLRVGHAVMSSNRRRSVRRAIGYAATIVAPDGAWTRKCRVVDISQTGAKLALEDSSGLPKDFVLMLSECGGPRRRCRVVWVFNDQIGVEFDQPKRGAAAA